MSMVNMHLHLMNSSRAEMVTRDAGRDAWLRVCFDQNNTLTIFPAKEVSAEKMAAFVAAFNDIMTSVAPAQIEEAA